MLMHHQGMSCHCNKKEAMFLSALLQETNSSECRQKQNDTRYIHSSFQEKLLSRPDVHKATTVIDAKTGNPGSGIGFMT